MDVVRRTADFAENQTKFFITDINSKDNGVRLKAIKRYKEYITTYRPEMYDDDVDFLFTGTNEHNGIQTNGLLHGCGQQSSKHDGQLKRIAGSLMAFLQWLITLECEGDIENIFFERFIRLPAAELVQMSLSKHIGLDNKSSLSGAGQRGGNTVIACEVLSTLMQYHLTEDGEPDPLDVDYMLNNDSASKLYFMKWLENSADDQILNAVVNRPAPVARQKAEVFADTWEDVQLRYVPLHADESGYGGEEELDFNEFDHIIPDPLGLSSIDLRSVIVHTHSVPQRDKRASEVTKSSASTKLKRMTTSSAQKMNIMKRIITKKHTKTNDKKGNSKHVGDSSSGKHQTGDVEEDTKSDCNEGVEEAVEENLSSSVIPSQKNFSPATFLSYVHGYVSLPNLFLGLKNLELRLDQQSSRREDLVRQNFGLFICCMDGLTWLKDFQGLNTSMTNHMDDKKKTAKKRATGSTHRRRVSFFAGGDDEVEDLEEIENSSPGRGIGIQKGGLKEASVFLSKAKDEAQDTLAPILSRMQRSRQLKNADQILRRLASFMEYPHAMKQLMAKGDYESVLNIYHRVESLPATSNLRILKRITTKATVIIEEMTQKLIAALMQTQPVLPIVARHMKLLNELESEDVCRGILQKCFDRQVQLFDDLVKGISTKLNDSLTFAYMKGQELNLNNNESSKPMSPQERRGSYAKGAQKNGGIGGTSHRRKGKRATLLSTAHRSFMDSMGAEDFAFDSDEEGSINNVDEFGASLSQFNTPNPDDTFLNSDKDSEDSISVSSLESSATSVKENMNQLRHILGDEFDKTFVDDDPDVDYAELLCNKVRVRDVTKMVDLIDQWLPSLHKLLQMLRTYSSNTTQSTASTQKRLTSFNANHTRGSTKSASVAYGKNQAVAAETKKIANVLGVAANFLQTVVLGFNSTFSSQKNKVKADEGSSVLVESISKVFHHMFQGTLVEPHLSESVMEISEIFEVVESILSSRDIALGQVEESSGDEMNFFGSSAYRESVLQIKSVAYDGENAVATKVMEQLITQTLVLTSSVNRGNASTKKKVRDIDDIIRVFENITVKHLHSLVSVVRSPAWIAKVVWDYVQKILDRFISSLALMAASVESLNDKAYAEHSIAKQLSFDILSYGSSGSNEEKVSVDFDEVVSAARLELENLEASLLNTQHIQLAKNKSLDFVKACVRLRTSTVFKLWTETNKIFPQNAPTSGPVTLLRQGSNLVDMTPDKRINSSGGGTEQHINTGRRLSASKSNASAQSNVEDRIALSTGSILVLEDNAVEKYLEFVLLNFRTNTHASYSVIVKNEMTSEMEHSRLHHRGLPTHISRILLDLGHIQSNLSTVLAGMTVSSSDSWKNNTSYEDYFFHMICMSVVTVFADLVDSLARNSFSLHSTGRKYHSRRLSNSTLAKGHLASAPNALNGPKDDEEAELRFYSTCKYPLSCGQALEELEFFKMAVLPVLLTASDIPSSIWIHDETNTSEHVGKKYLSRDGLLQEGLLFVEALRNKSSVCKKK